MAWQPSKLTPAQREERRMEAARLLREGWQQKDIARELSVSPAAVCTWARRLKERGEEGLRERHNPGRASYLTPMQWTEVCALLEAGAMASGFPTERWTLRRVAQLIEERYGVHYHPNYLAEPLRRLGFSPQRPPTQAQERNDELVKAWVKRDWPRIKRGLVEGGQRLPSWMRQATRFGPG